MSSKDLEEVLHVAVAEAADTMDKLHRVPMTFKFVLRDGLTFKLDEDRLTAMGCDLGSEAHKDHLGDMVRDMAAFLDVDYYVHYSESWVVTRTSEEVDAQEKSGRPFVMPRNDPRRFEAVHYVAESKTHLIFARQGIVRPAGKEPWVNAEDLSIDIVERGKGGHTEYRGRFIGVLGKKLSAERFDLMAKIMKDVMSEEEGETNG